MGKVSVIGLGYIGLPTAAMLALHGSEVSGFDIRPNLLDSLGKGNVSVRERDLTAIVRDALQSGRLRIVAELQQSEYFIICVPTPLEGHEADLNAVQSAAQTVSKVVRRGSCVVLESTVPPGTTINLVRPILEKSGLVAGKDFHLAYCPERVMPGRIVHEIAENDRIIGGMTPTSAERARDLYATFVRGQIFLTDLTTAEFVKLAENAFRDVNIALANELAILAEAHGIDVWQAIELANKHPRVKFLNPGPGVGGHCIAVDPWFLLTPKAKAALIPAARSVNDSRPGLVAQRVRKLVRGVNRPKVGTLGAAYKGNTDDIRESPAIRVVEDLEASGVAVAVYDPFVPNELFPTVPLEDCIDGADCVLILTDHREFRYLDPALIAERVRRRILFDTRNSVDHEAWKRCGFEVHVLGRAEPDEIKRRLPIARTPPQTPAASRRH